MKTKKIIAMVMMSIITLMSVSGCGEVATKNEKSTTTKVLETENQGTTLMDAEVKQTTVAPKYVFLFIGDGMTYPQFQATSSYLGTIAETDDVLDGSINLSFMDFPVAGSVTTYDSTSFCPDSASTATSIATGHKTYSGVLNMDETKTIKYLTIAEQLKSEKNYKIGVVSSVNLNHATPAAFYAHQDSRNNYYDIGLELIDSNFDYFAGGGLKKITGDDKENPQTDLYELAAQGGYTVVKTQAEAAALTQADGKVLAIAETLADSDSMSYEIDRAENEWGLSDYVSKGIELLENDNGFFMMVEGGKIDWACHANDAGSTINDVLAFDDAVQVAIDFAKLHEDETLIIVTGDHETGGLSIGFAGTNYSTYLNNIINQKISYSKYDADYVAGYVENKVSFETAMADVENLFGLVMPEKAVETTPETLVLNDYEVEQLKKAYDLALNNGYGTDADGNSLQTQGEYVEYGSYSPFSVTVTHLLNNKSGINFASYSHTGLPAAVFAYGVEQDDFSGSYDNTDIYKKLADILEIK